MMVFHGPRGQSQSVCRVATIFGLVILSAVFLVLCMDRRVNLYDEGLILFGADRVLDHAIPHRDFYANYGPGQFYVLAALYKIFGASVLIERAWDTLVRIAIVSLVFVVVRQAAPCRLALLGAGACLVWLGKIGGYATPVFPTLAAVLAGIAFLSPALVGAISPVRMIAAGICAGVAALFRYDVGIAAFGVQGAVLAIATWCQCAQQANRFGSVVWRLLLFGFGFLLIVGPMIAFFVANGVIPDLVFDIFIFPSQFYAKVRSLPFPRPWWRGEVLVSAEVYLPLVICAAALPTTFSAMRAQLKGRQSGQMPGASAPTMRLLVPWMLVMMIVITLILFAKAWVRISIDHTIMALIASLALAALLVQPMPGRSWFARIPVIIATVMIIATTISGTFAGLRSNAQRNIGWAMKRASWEGSANGEVPAAGTCHMPLGMERLACFEVDADFFAAARYVQSRTTPDEPVFVGLSRHDMIFVNDVLLYFALHRKSATKWHHFDPGLQTSMPIQREMVAELQHAKPKLIVLDSRWADVREPNDSALSSGVTLLDDYLKQAYAPVAVFGSNTVLQLRTLESAP